MKKVLFLLIILLPIKLFALSGSASISCPTTVLEQNKIYKCSVSGYSSEEVSALQAVLSSSSNLVISDVQTSSIWQGNGSGGRIDLYTDTNKKGNFAIATFNIKLTDKNTSTLSINSIKYADAGFIAHSIGARTINFSVKKEATTTKKVETTTKQTKTTTTKQTSKNENTQETKENNAYLKELNISNVKLNFNSNTFKYETNVSNEIKEVTIKAIAESSKAKVIAPTSLKLNEGKNELIIKVVAEDGSSKEYKIIINKLDRKLSNNSLLKHLEIAGIKLNFNSNTKTYDLGSVKKHQLDIHYLTEDENAKVYIYGNKNLSKNDVVVIKVIAEDSSSSEYILYVNNLAKDKNIIIILSTISIVLMLSIIAVFIRKNKD